MKQHKERLVVTDPLNLVQKVSDQKRNLWSWSMTGSRSQTSMLSKQSTRAMPFIMVSNLNLVVRRLPSSRSSASIVMAWAGHICGNHERNACHSHWDDSYFYKVLVIASIACSLTSTNNTTNCPRMKRRIDKSGMHLRKIFVGSKKWKNSTHRLTKLASNAPFFTRRISTQSMLPSETRTQRALLKWIIYLYHESNNKDMNFGGEHVR